MKLRILNQSIRLRLTRTEVEVLAHDGRVEAVTELSAARLVYAVESRPDLRTPRARLAVPHGRAELTVQVPHQAVREWATSDDRVGIYADEVVGDDPGPKISIEKDFRCAVPRSAEEDPEDAYPLPPERC